MNVNIKIYKLKLKRIEIEFKFQNHAGNNEKSINFVKRKVDFLPFGEIGAGVLKIFPNTHMHNIKYTQNCLI